MVPLLQGYEDAGDFTVKARLRTSLHGNLVFYLSLGSVALSGLILLIALNKFWFASLSFRFFLFFKIAVVMLLQRPQNLLYSGHNCGCRMQFKTMLYTARFFKSLQANLPYI